MIIVCEPQCRSISHEKVNSGFLYGLSRAYPSQMICFYADSAHIQSIKNILKIDNTEIKNIKFFPIKLVRENGFGLIEIFKLRFLIKYIFNETQKHKENKIFFLSNNPVILYTIKKLKQLDKYKNICCTLVLHGELEDIVDFQSKRTNTSKNKAVTFSITNQNIFNKIIEKHHLIIPFFINKISQPYFWILKKYSHIFKKIFKEKEMLLWQHSNHIKYISLSPHVTKNAKQYIDVNYLNFNTIVMPIIFAKPTTPFKNKYIKFAVFGYGDSQQMYRMLSLLSTKKISKKYEIKVISMDRRGTDGFPNITYVGEGKVLSRLEMEKSLPDVDIFINLYDRNRHRLGCSGSIFEAFSYLKPVLHLSNDGYNYFNNSKKPIGYRCEDMNSFVDKMTDLIENYPKNIDNLKIFRKNMMDYRKKYSIINNLNKLRKSFSFDKI